MSDAGEYDLIVVGLGINGAAIARDSALRGLRVVAFDRADSGAETSAWNSRLIHGGLRYLEHAEFGLVRESLRERRLLLRHAPHLVEPLRLTIPVFDDSRRGRWTIKAGMTLYDLLSLGKALPRHRMLGRTAAVEASGGVLRDDDLIAAATYWDAQIVHPERLALELVLDARAHGADIHTWTAVEGLIIEDGAVRGVRARDTLTDQACEARARVVVNAAGPWVDRLLAGRSERLIGGTKGSHVVVNDITGLPRDRAWYTEAHADGRPFFIIPWLGRWLIGTTDLRFDADPADARAEPPEIDYLLAETNRLFPRAGLSASDVVFTWSAVRPLPHQPGAKPAEITRKHLVIDHTPELRNLLSVVGGKLTTHRSLAEDAVNHVVRILGRHVPCATRDAPLPGSPRGDAAALREIIWESCADVVLADRLFRVYGRRALDLLALADAGGLARERVSDDPPVLAAEVAFAVEHEAARTLEDVLFRRLMVGLEPGALARLVEPVGALAAQRLGWDAGELADQRVRVERFARRFTPSGCPPTRAG